MLRLFQRTAPIIAAHPGIYWNIVNQFTKVIPCHFFSSHSNSSPSMPTIPPALLASPPTYFIPTKPKTSFVGPLINPALMRSLTTSKFMPVRYFSDTSSDSSHTSKPPINGLKLLYANIVRSEARRREIGVVPKDLFCAGKHYFSDPYYNNEGLKQFKRMLLVHPFSQEVDYYKKAGEILLNKGYLDEGIQFFEHASADNLLDKYKEVGNILFHNGCIDSLDKAINFFEKGKVNNLPELYSEAGDRCYEAGDIIKAIQYYEKALLNGCQSLNVYMRLGNLYLKSGDLKNNDITKAQDYYQSSYALCTDHKAQAYVLNELGVAFFMNATTWRGTDTFYDRQKTAFEYFHRALASDPNNSIILKNLDIAKKLTAEPNYGQPYKYLTFELGKPTLLFDPVLAELRKHSKHIETRVINGHTGPNFGIDTKGDMTVMFGTSTTSSMDVSVDDQANILAIHKLLKLRAQWTDKEIQQDVVRKMIP